MENTHDLKPVHDPLFCEEGDIPFEVHLVNKDGSKFKTIQEEFHYPKDIPACNPENTCEVIQDFLEEKEIDELEIIKNQFDLAFKDRSRLRILREYILLQLKDIDAELDVVRKTIETLDDRYLKYIKNNL